MGVTDCQVRAKQKLYMSGGFFLIVLVLTLVSYMEAEETTVDIVFSQSKTLGADRQAFDNLLQEFSKENPGIRVILRELPNSSDRQHQYYLTSLGGGATDIDLLAIDVVWVSEFAQANWLVPFSLTAEEKRAFLPGTLRACTYGENLVALPWYTDSGLLYYRRDLLDKYGVDVPKTWQEMAKACGKILAGEKAGNSPVQYGLICQGKHYEGLVCSFLEVFRGCGGEILDGTKVILNTPQGKAAFRKFYSLVHEEGVIPDLVNNLDEERSLRLFLSEKAIFMRNWPYAWSLMQQDGSSLQGKVGVAPLPHLEGYSSSATLGGWQLAVSSYSRHPLEAARLARFLTSAKAQKVLSLHLGSNPTLASLYQDGELLAKRPFMQALYEVFVHAEPRPVTPLYPRISQILQREVSLLIATRKNPETAADDAARELTEVFRRQERAQPASPYGIFIGIAVLLAVLVLFILFKGSLRDNMSALAYLAPALIIIVTVALLPLLYAVFLAFHQVEVATIMQPERWIPCGLENFRAMLGDVHFGRALLNTMAIAIITVSLELFLGLTIALLLAKPFVGRGPMRALILLPWILPTVVAAKMWSWVFATSGGLANYILSSLGLIGGNINWINPLPAFISIIVAEVWKTTPFMAILLIAGLTNIPEDLYRSAKVDGASAWYTFTRVTLPLLRPAILLALLFRSMDALRIFDVVYAMTEYAESTKTLSIYVYEKMGTGDLSYAAALSIVTFLVIFAISLMYLALFGKKMGVRS